MSTIENGTPKLRPSPVERHHLNLSYLSPWDRSSSDPNLSPPHVITGKRHSRRQLMPQCQFRSSITNNGDLEFRPEYREVFVAHPPDACASPRLTKRRQQRARCATVEGVGLATPEASLVGTEEDDGTKHSQLVNEENTEQIELPRQTSAVYTRRQSTPNFYDTEFRSQYIPLTIEDRVQLLRRATTLHLEGEQYFDPVYKSTYIDSPRKRYTKPPKPLSNLQVEGDFYTETEVNSKFLPYIILRRSELKRHNTQLNLEGDMHIDPEYRASFIEYPLTRSVIIKPRENLHIAGPDNIMIGVSEQREKFSSVPLSPRPELVRHPTNLQIGGGNISEETRHVLRRARPATVHADFAPPSNDLDTTPEYRASFRDFPRRRPETLKPAGTLSSEGPWLGKSPEYRSAFTDFPRSRPETKKQGTSLQPFGGVNESREYRESYKDFPRKRPQLNKPIQNLKPEGDLMATSPEYKEKFQNFPRQRPDIKKATETLKPEGEFTNKNSECKENYKDSPRMRPKVIKPSGNIKMNIEKMDKSPEYKEEFKDFPRQRPRTQKPIQHLRPEGEMFEQKAEYHESYVDFPRQRPEMTRPEGNLKSEGPWLGRFPEYRAAFIDLPRHRPVLLRPAEGLSTPDALGGGYAPTFDGTSRSDLLRPQSATSPRSLSPAGIATGAPKHNKRSYSQSTPRSPRSPRRPVSRAGHLDEACPPSRTSPSLLQPQPSVDSFEAFQIVPETTVPREVIERQVKFELPECQQEPDLMSPIRARRSSPRIAPPASVSAFKVIEASDKVVRARRMDLSRKEKTRGTGEIGKWGTGWLTTNPSI